MRNPDQLNILRFLVHNWKDLVMEYFFGDRFEKQEVPVGAFKIWLLKNHKEHVDLFTTINGDVFWHELLCMNQIPLHIQQEYIVHLEKIKSDLEMEAA